MTTYTAEQIEAIGGKRWTSPDGTITRVYLDESVWAPLVGLDVERYKTGNISRAYLNGEKISNGKAAALLRIKVYLSGGDNNLWIDNGAELDREIRAAVDAAVTPVASVPAAEPEVPAAPAPAGHATAMVYTLSIGALNRMGAERGPRWMVSAVVRKNEYCAAYADTAERAEELRDDLDGKSYRGIRVAAPVGSIDLAEFGRARRAAKAAYDEATAVLRAGVLRALEAGREETEIARTALVDRQTVRAWAGKQPMHRG